MDVIGESVDPWYQRRITNKVYLVGIHKPKLFHHCPNLYHIVQMIEYDNKKGPGYKCRCGYVLDEGTSMAIRLNEMEIS